MRKLRFRYEPLITVLIHRNHILHNLKAFQTEYPNVAIAPVLKSNAYGHGLVQIAQILDDQRLPFLCIDSYFEALILRNEGVRTPLLIIGYTPVETILDARIKNVAYAILDLEGLMIVARRARAPIAIHLKIDTGMHRHGILPGELSEALNIIKKNHFLKLEGIYSHAADADTPNSPHTKLQIERWNNAVRKTRESISAVKYFHFGATAGSSYSSQIDANVLRLGIGLYGINISLNKNLNLQPALEMRTRLTSFRTIEPGEHVGYNGTFTAAKKMKIASLPAGYAEGVDRRLSNCGTILLGNIACPIVGRVSMNITSIDISSIPDTELYKEVTVISAEQNAPNSIEHMAKLCDTTPHELLVHIPAHLRRKTTT